MDEEMRDAIRAHVEQKLEEMNKNILALVDLDLSEGTGEGSGGDTMSSNTELEFDLGQEKRRYLLIMSITRLSA